MVHPIGFRGWLRRWRLSYVFEVDHQVSWLNRCDVIGANESCPIVGGRENQCVVFEATEGFLEGDEDLIVVEV